MGVVERILPAIRRQDLNDIYTSVQAFCLVPTDEARLRRQQFWNRSAEADDYRRAGKQCSNGAGTYRLQEILALGRAPVTISDDWVPIAEMDWERLALFVKERDPLELPAILREQENRWKEMGARALQIHNAFFRLESYTANAMRHTVEIYRNRWHDERDFILQWDQVIEAAKRRAKE